MYYLGPEAPDRQAGGVLNNSTIIFAVAPGEEGREERLGTLCEKLSDRTGLAISVAPQRSYRTLLAQFASGTVHAAWTPPLLAAELRRAKLVETLLRSKRESGRSYHAVFIVAAGSEFRSVLQLRGGSAAWVDPTSASGYLVPRQWLRSKGIEPRKFFSKHRTAHTHVGVVDTVVRGDADVGATFAIFGNSFGEVLKSAWLTTGQDVEIIANAGTVPSDGISFSTRIPAPKVSELSAAIIAIAQAEPQLMLALFETEQFEQSDADYLAALDSLVSSEID